jgi:hypothetical protein
MTLAYTGICSDVATNPIESYRNLLSKRRTASGLMIVFVKVILPSYEKEDNIWMDSEAQKM